MPRFLSRAAACLLMLGLATCGPPSADEPPPPVEEWLVGEWFLGGWGDEYWDHHVINWTRIDDDGTWTYGVRGCDGEPMFFGGTWREREPGVVEFTADNEIDILPFSGYLGETAVMRFEDTCTQVEVVYFDAEGEPYETTHMVTRGVACLDDCSSSKRIAVPCPDMEDPC
ncbi:MAG: hypothetical protein HC888_14105, partial [Candidatus Competibacteraceae bacterium]|nr:hypothetical protein [Candidatus Competibacteraceae bacterium]